MSEPSPFDTRLAAYCVVVEGDADDGRVLLALWNESDPPRWTLPGGGVDLEETPEEGAVREVREETGYDVVLDGLLGVETGVIGAAHRFSGSGRPLKAVRVLYAAHVVGGTLRDEVGGTTDEARWWPMSEVADLPQVRAVGTALRMWRAQRSG